MKGPPDPAGCQGPADVDKFVRDEETGIDYQCVYDKRWDVFTWVIVPPVDP